MPEPVKRRLGESSSPPPRSAAPPGRPGPAANKPALSAPRPAARRPAPSRGEPPAREVAPAKNKKLVLFGAIGGGALLLIVLAAVMMSGNDKPRRSGREEAAPPPPPPPVAVKAKPETPGPSKSDVDEDFKKAIEGRKSFQEQQAKKIAERERKEKEEKTRADAEKEAEKKEADAKERDALAGYENRKRDRRAESAKRLEEAVKGVEDDRKSEIARQKALVEKLKNLKLSLKMKTGLALQNVAVQGMTRDELKLAFTYEGSQAEQAFPIEFVEDRSYVDLLKAIYKGEGASGSYELGRNLVLRKLWKDAQAAFEECVKQDGSYSARVPDLSRILHNEAAFKGSARKIGSDQLFITYDFSDAAQAQDFTPVQMPGQAVIEGGELKLTSPLMGAWSLKGVDFERDLEVDAVAIFDTDKTALVFGSFYTFERKGYFAVVNSQNPPGHLIHRVDGPQKAAVLVAQAAPKIVAGAETRIRFQVKSGVFRVFIGDQEVINQADATYNKGWCLLGAAGGTIRFKKLTIQGHVNPLEIDKRFAEVEVLVRRALESDLGKKKSDEADVDPLSAEDEYLLGRLPAGTRGDFEKKRSALVKALQKRQIRPEHVTSFDGIVQSNPDFAAGHYWKAVAQMQGRKTDEAKTELAQAIRLFPDFHEAELLMAQVQLEDRDFAGATARIQKALALSPGFGDAVALGAYLKFLNTVASKGYVKSLPTDVKEAATDLEVARKLDPSSESVATTQKNVANVVKGPQHLGAKYEKEFPHYVVMTDMSKEKTELYGTRLEAAYKFYVETFKDVFTEDAKRPKPRVAIFNTREAYLTYGELTLSNRQEWTLGYFHPMYRELLLFEDVDQEATLQTLYHEAFHQFMALMVPRAPFWYNEGIAEFMGGIKVEIIKAQSKIIERARILDGRLKGLKMSLNFALKFEDIMMQTPAQFYSGPVSFKYAQAWSMVHFLYEASGGKHRPKIEAYFRKLKEGGTPREAYQAAFGESNIEELQKEWLEYVKKMEPLKK
jgi:tetratricopeptide (TPR) repeat protein